MTKFSKVMKRLSGCAYAEGIDEAKDFFLPVIFRSASAYK
jgi:hypothetical protein